MTRRSRLATTAAILGVLMAALVVACAPNPPAAKPGQVQPASSQPAGASQAVVPTMPLPASAYYVPAGLPSWEDTTTGYDTAKHWEMSGGTWPIALFMNPALAPQLLAGMQAGVYKSNLSPLGITPVVEPIDGPPRAFHALERSKWPFIYVPISVFMNYVRSPVNEGGAGGLQYVAIAGSMSASGRTLMARDASIKSIADLAGKTVGIPDASTPAIALLAEAAAKVGLKVGDGPADIHMGYGTSSDILNDYAAGKYDGVMVTNILKAQVAKSGSHTVDGFYEVGLDANLVILCVERTVLEQRPEVVKAFLEAHFQGEQLAQRTWSTTAPTLSMNEWNAYFQDGPNQARNQQRVVPDVAAYKAMIGAAHPADRLSRDFVLQNFEYMNTRHTWGWPGIVDASKLVDFDLYNQVLKEHGVKKLQ
jgi:ABC-type amino acid transport substrate-binding protein